MIQIVAARQFGTDTKASWIYTDPPIVLPSVISVFKYYAEIVAKLPAEERFNLFFTLSHHNGYEGARRPVRTSTTFDRQTVIAWDIDKADTDQAYDYAEALASLLTCPRESLIIVNSGNGVHLYANLRFPISQAKYFSDNHDAYKEICKKLDAKFTERGLPGKCDTSIFEPARLLRVPGTMNRKPGLPEKPCTLIQMSDAVLDFELAVVSGLDTIQKENISPLEVRRKFPNPDFKEMAKECHFMKWGMENVQEVHEPQAFDLFSLLACQSPTSRVDFQGREMDGKEVAEWVFNNATASESLKRQDFSEKWDQAGRYGGRKCETINARWEKGCKECPHYGKIATPLQLKSRTHLGSETTGFWVLNAKGQPSYPHYEDLSKVFASEHSYITTKDERLFAFRETHYDQMSPLLVKSWLEKKVTPSEPLREVHRNEFVHKVHVSGALSMHGEEELFTNSIKGKLNCRNGVVDIMKGLALPHSKNYGFQYCLPYDFNEGLASEFFLDWLSQITDDRTELMESLLDIMAYTLWPTYDDHLFAYFVGEGSNGKSTLIHIIQELVGKDNFSSVSIQQLSGNRFAPASLEGKLVNLSEEDSGSELGFEETNIIKNLSAGGEMFVEQKNKQGHTFRNRAKLIFSANKTPRFLESGVAIKRRMLVIPFDHQIKNPDSSVQDRLIAEAPAILSMLVRRIQENVIRHNGRFVVYRGGAASAAAQKIVLTKGNTVVDWAAEKLESSAELPLDRYVTVNDAYAAYSAWCDESGFRHAANRISFGKSMKEFVLTRAVGDEQLLKIGGKTTRVYPRTRFKEGDPDVSL